MAFDTLMVVADVYPDLASAGLVVVGVMDMEARTEEAMRRSEKLEKKQLKADVQALERDAKDATDA